MSKHRNPIDHLLASPDKGASQPSGVHGVLAAMFRKIMGDIGMNGMRWTSLMTDFILDSNNGVPNNRKDQTSRRGNLMKELARERMTWKVFCKALCFLKFRKFDLIIRPYHPDGRVTEHELSVDLGGRVDLGAFLEELNAEDPENFDSTDENDSDQSEQKHDKEISHAEP